MRRARFVRIDDQRLERYAAELPSSELGRSGTLELPAGADSAESRAAFVLTLNAVNFGSGYFPYLRKLPGCSGYRTLETRLRQRFEQAGELSSAELREMDPGRCRRLFGQETASTEVSELMGLYARAWRDLGTLLETRFGGCFLALVEAARGRVERLVAMLLEMPLYRDVARYDELEVPFLKRAQLAALDLDAALAGRSAAYPFGDLERLTLCADNLVAHVLRMDGVLGYESGLGDRIERGEPLPAGSQEEVEIRASEVEAVERIVAAVGGRITAAELDGWLWRRGGAPRYKARPRHRTRCPYY